MATQNLTTFDAILKNVYRGPIVELLNQETYLIDQITKQHGSQIGTFAGRQLIFPIHTARNRGRGALTDGSTLPTAGKQSYLDAIVNVKYFATAIELTDMVIEQSKTDEGAFVRALNSEMDSAMTDMRKDISRMAYGTGNGLLATITGTPNGTSITVDSGQYIAVGDTIDILVKSSGATTNGVVATTVTGVSFSGATANSSTQTNATLTISPGSAGALSTSYGVYISGDRSNESDGLQNIISTSRTLHQIDSSTNPIWDSNTINGGQVNLGEDTLMQLSQTIRQRSGKQIDSYLTSLGVQRRLAGTYASQKRWNDDHVTEVDGGYSAIMVAAGNKPVPVIADVDAPAGVAFALNKETLAWAELRALDWLDSPDGKGSILHLKPGSTAGTFTANWIAYAAWYATLVCTAPHRNGKVTALNDDVPVVRV